MNGRSSQRRRRLVLEPLERRLVLSSVLPQLPAEPLGDPPADVAGPGGGPAANAFLDAAKDQTEDQKLTASDAAGHDRFGSSVAISGDTAIIGALHAGEGGAAYVFGFDGNRWVERQKLTASDGAVDDLFGGSAAISGQWAVVGAADHSQENLRGAAYMFRFDGARWVQQQKLTASDADVHDRFGNSVAISGNAAIVTASHDDARGPDSGSAYVFRFDGSRWVETQKLTASDGGESDFFGAGVTLDGQVAAIRAGGERVAPNCIGAVYVFRFDGTRWLQTQKLTAFVPTPGEDFGVPSISGEHLLVSKAGGYRTVPGTVWCFRYDGARWVQQQKLEDFTRDRASVSVHGDTAVVGNWGEQGLGGDQAAYLYQFQGARWVQRAKLTASDWRLGDDFGRRVRVSGQHVIVGAPDHDEATLGEGAAYAFNVPMVVDRHVFYNNSAFDGGDPAAGPEDDLAIAPDKRALSSGQTATAANYTSFSRGINGIMVDVSYPGGNISRRDFYFKVGNDGDPASWAPAPRPSNVTVRPGAGTRGSDRVTITWPDGAIGKQWLQVTIPAGGVIGLSQPDVFYFGNAIGESCNSTTDAKVTAADMLAARDNQRNFLDPAPIDFRYDYNRDRRVNAADMLIARNNQTHFLNALKLITTPGGSAPGGSAPGGSAPGGSAAAVKSQHAGAVLCEVPAWLQQLERPNARQVSDHRHHPAGPALHAPLLTPEA